MPILRSFADKYDITYRLLSDEGSKVITEFGLLNRHVNEQNAALGITTAPRHTGVPYPGTFLLDERGVIVEKRFYQTHRERDTGAGLLETGFHVSPEVHGAVAGTEHDGIAVLAWLDSDTYRPFQQLYLSVELTLPPRLHVYGRPIPQGFIPLSVQVAPIAGVEIGEAALPPTRPFRIAGLDEQFFVYERSVRAVLPVMVTVRDAGDLLVQVDVRYQACSDTDCLPPVSATLELPLEARPFVASATAAPQPG